MLAAKWLVYAVLAVAQAGLITLVFCAFPNRGPDRSLLAGPETGLFLSLAALTVAAMTLGLLISTLAAKLEHAVAIVTATSIGQIALNGVTSHLSGKLATSMIAALLPDRWGLAAAASAIDLRSISAAMPTTGHAVKGHAVSSQAPAVGTDALWRHSTGQWSQDLIALGLLCCIYFALAVWRLHVRLRPSRPQRRRAR